MAGIPTHSDSATRRHILRAAARSFAHRGYAGSSVQQIVTAARVSKPTLYYYFRDKAGLFQALVDEAHDERFRIMRTAVERCEDLRGQLVEILNSMFDFLRNNRELMRIAFATTLAAPGELPSGLRYMDKCERNFEFIHQVFERALREGLVDRRFTSRELAYGFYGLLNAYMVSHLLMPDCVLNRQTAARIVELFLSGASRSVGKVNGVSRPLRQRRPRRRDRSGARRGIQRAG